MAAYPIPLVPPYTLWLASDEPLRAALAAAVAPQGFEVRDICSAANPLIRAQAVFHDVRTLLRDTDSLTTLWSIAAGHGHSVIIAAIEDTASNAGLGFETFGVPSRETRFRLVSVHRHLLDDRPDVVARFHDCLRRIHGAEAIALTEARLQAIQAEADGFFKAGLIPACVDIRAQSADIIAPTALTA